VDDVVTAVVVDCVREVVTEVEDGVSVGGCRYKPSISVHPFISVPSK
jgi:hypothetical protein